MGLFLTGFILGLSIAAPVGPIGLLCIHRTLAEGRASGFVSGLGAATADASYGLAAALGLTAISSLLLGYQMIIKTAGVVFLMFLAGRIFFSATSANAARGELRVSLIRSYVSTFFLTIANPLTILSFLAVFAGLGIGTSTSDYAAAVWVDLGVFLGSACWWLLLSTCAGFFKMNDERMRWVHRISGVSIAALGIASLFK